MMLSNGKCQHFACKHNALTTYSVENSVNGIMVTLFTVSVITCPSKTSKVNIWEESNSECVNVLGSQLSRSVGICTNVVY